jgi:hypothetical protein
MEHAIELGRQGAQSQASSRHGGTPSTAPVHPVLQLQHQVGNRAVGLYLRDIPGSRGMSHGRGGSSRQIPSDRPLTVQRQCSCGGTCASCQNKQVDGDPFAPLQRNGSSLAHSAAEPSVVPERSTSHPPDQRTRAFMEPRFGRDLSNIRIHTDHHAAHSADSLAANAYTTGRDIYFAAGKYAPQAHEGRHLLAHELTHVMQQQDGAVPMAASRSGSVLVGHADDPLEAEAEQVAEKVSRDTQNTSLDKVPLRTSDLSTTQWIQRDSHAGFGHNSHPTRLPAGFDTSEQKAQDLKDKDSQPIPPDEIARIKQILMEDPDTVRSQLERAAIDYGAKGPQTYLDQLEQEFDDDRELTRIYRKGGDQMVAAVADYYSKKSDQLKVLSVVRPLVAELERKRTSFIADFEQEGKNEAVRSLDASQRQEEFEAKKFGIQINKKQQQDCFFGSCEDTTYTMGGQSANVAGLKGAATFLLNKKRELKEPSEAIEHLCSGRYMGGVSENCDEAKAKYDEKGDPYEAWREYLSQKYPILYVFADPDEEDTSKLEELANQEEGPGMAKLIGEEINTRLKNIKRVRDNLDDRDEINIWTLPNVVGVVTRLLGAEADPLKARWISDEVEAEQPHEGYLKSLALLVLNVGALLLAAPTGGISLEVALVVNTAVTAAHVQTYLTEKALAGTSFEKAKALSQDEPSFFWLAIEIAGVAIDAVAAYKAISEAAKLVEAAQLTGDAAAELAQLKKVAEPLVGKDLAESIATHLGEGGTAESKALKALGATEKDIELLKAGETAAAKELDDGVLGLEAAEDSPIKISNQGHIYSCNSPCEYLVDKYAEILGPEAKLEGETAALQKEYLAFEKRAAGVAEDVRVSKLTKVGEKKAQKAVDSLKKEIEVFDRKIGNKIAYSNASKKLNLLEPTVAKRILALEDSAVVRMAELDGPALERLSTLETSSLKKLGALPESALRRVATLDEKLIAKFADLDEKALGYFSKWNSTTLEQLGKLKPEALRRIAAAEIRSPFAMRQLAESVGPTTSLRKLGKAIAKAERHEAILTKAFEASEAGDWTAFSGKGERQSIGRHIGYEVEEYSRVIASGGRAKEVLHYEQISEQLLTKLDDGESRILITQGRLRGGDLRFDIAEIDFRKRTVDLIDLAPNANRAHINGTDLYRKELSELLPNDFVFESFENHYVGADGRVLEDLQKVGVGK